MAMSYLIDQNGDSFDVRVVGLEDPLATAYPEAYGGEPSPDWVVDVTGIAEHLEHIKVADFGSAYRTLHAIGHAFEAGGGGS
ncbi:hypothetical protein BKG71_00780 [Mycobacteroides chelonae]|nr:hypothetical protein [Mycobacteroides chelonae]MBF9420220.1 hypothetical protein [Mycobacteroides chelonae]MBF9438688.1 hypothetical protein [Mycobacteroides chelonae]MBV6359997.1 hypothetical protein [Mycobacteroides chelonae]OHT50329.1 hypothetical protein BKG63_20255 [Mycobacteroides chelonae]